MGFDLNALAGKTAITKVEFMGQSALITYNPSVLTAEVMMNAKKSDDGFVETFTTLVTDWDVKRGNKKVPITKKGLEGIPLPLLKAIFAAIMGDSGGDREEGKDSSAG